MTVWVTSSDKAGLVRKPYVYGHCEASAHTAVAIRVPCVSPLQ